ncbi:TPA: hypothetical protein JD771_002470 [Legionella pneumophila subsp. pneumophila]|nr:hypothetical protein [Legionella pneumophila subsp. pneumophila]
MSFLSGETIFQRLNELVQNEAQQGAGNVNQIDCNSYELKIGPEIYITQELTGDKDKAYQQLGINSSFTIPSGQFAIILTEEYINIPKDLFGLISMKSKLKLQGLINISGFHVDPGWRGRLKFSVYNAGPHDIVLKRGENVFLIWFAKLDIEESKKVKTITGDNIQSSLTSQDINSVRGQVHSPQTLMARMDALEKKIMWKWAAFIIAIFVGILVGVSMDFTSDYLSYHKGYKQEIIKGVVDEMMSKNKNSSETKKE